MFRDKAKARENTVDWWRSTSALNASQLPRREASTSSASVLASVFGRAGLLHGDASAFFGVEAARWKTFVISGSAVKCRATEKGYSSSEKKRGRRRGGDISGGAALCARPAM